jgi:CBS domain-containing protein
MMNQTTGSYMIPIGEFPVINENETVYRAIRFLKYSLHKGGAWKGHRLAVALDNCGNATGILTIKSLLNSVILKMLEEDTFFKAECFSWYYIEDIRRKGRVTVREVMRPLMAFSIDRSQPVSEAAKLFTRHGINHLPVMEGQKLIGILNARDLFYGYYELTRFRPLRESRAGELTAPANLINKPATV